VSGAAAAEVVPEAVRDIVAAVAGSPWAATDRSTAEGAAQVTRVDGPQGRLWVKTHRQARTAEQEARALRAAASVGDVPELHAVAGTCLVMTHVDGGLASERAAWARAGAWLGRWHAMPVDDDDPMPLIDAVRARAEAWAARAHRVGAPGLAGALALTDAESAALVDAQRVWCHRDYHPRNWLDDGARVGVIDFEHARPDLAEFDLAKVRASEADAPLRAAFVDAWTEARGQAPDRVLLALGDRMHVVVTWVWGTQRGHAPTIAEGARALARSGLVVADERSVAGS